MWSTTQGLKHCLGRLGRHTGGLLHWTSSFIVEWTFYLQPALRARLRVRKCIHREYLMQSVHKLLYAAHMRLRPELRLHILSILHGRRSGFTLWSGLQCSSWVSICRHSTKRSFLHPEGQETPAVVMGNQQLCRRPCILEVIDSS